LEQHGLKSGADLCASTQSGWIFHAARFALSRRDVVEYPGRMRIRKVGALPSTRSKSDLILRRPVRRAVAETGDLRSAIPTAPVRDNSARYRFRSWMLSIADPVPTAISKI